MTPTTLSNTIQSLIDAQQAKANEMNRFLQAIEKQRGCHCGEMLDPHHAVLLIESNAKGNPCSWYACCANCWDQIEHQADIQLRQLGVSVTVAKGRDLFRPNRRQA